MKLYFSWARHLLAAAAFSEGWVPRNLGMRGGSQDRKAALSAPLQRIDADNLWNGVEMSIGRNDAFNVLAVHHGGVHRVAGLKIRSLAADLYC